MPPLRAVLIWSAFAAAVAIPIAAAAASPFLQYRSAIYVIAGFAGIVGLALILAQPLLVGGYLPGLPSRPGRRTHRFVGFTLVALIIAHVGGLWLTSPPDVIDALLFDSPTPFSVWGVIAMWAAFAAAVLATLRGRVKMSPKLWRNSHKALVAVVVTGTVAHALLIEGAMELITKAALCALVLAATAKVMLDLRR